jgi:TonB family protein
MRHAMVPPEVRAGKDCKEVEAPVLLDCVEPGYPTDVRKARLEGKVVAVAVLTPDGNLEGIRVSSSPSETLSNVALKAFGQWHYKPAFCRDTGQPVQVHVTMTTTFSLR